jgi:thiol-disulfide isomerase/thioredoxin
MDGAKTPRPAASPGKLALLVGGVAAAAIAIGLLAWNVLVEGPSRERARLEAVFGIDRAAVPAPPIETPTVGGGRFSLASARGQVVFVNFWATWCAPCREEMPSMVRLGQELERAHPGKFRMVAISVDESPEPIREFFAGSPPRGLVVALDPDQLVTRAYYCTARGRCPDSMKFPETYIVDRDGRLVAYVVGPRDWSRPEARIFLERLIGS